jgi:hypothetical protein
MGWAPARGPGILVHSGGVSLWDPQQGPDGAAAVAAPSTAALAACLLLQGCPRFCCQARFQGNLGCSCGPSHSYPQPSENQAMTFFPGVAILPHQAAV